MKMEANIVGKIVGSMNSPLKVRAGISSVPGRIVIFSTKTGILRHWKRDLAI
jgi:hypothetical protein